MRNVLTRTATVIPLILALLVPAAASAQPASDSAAPPTMTRHYLDPFGIASAGAEQCKVEPKDRKGAWFCPKPGNPAVQSGTCSVFGCWEYVNNFTAEFEGDGVYGYRGTIIGEAYFSIEAKFPNGGNSLSKPFQFESSRATRSVAASGERLYFSTAHPEGNPECCFKTWSGGSYPSMTLVNCFGSTGYTAYENTDAWAGIAHQFQWKDPSSAYPGTWWAWIKSPKFQRNSNGAYVLSNPPPMGSSWFGSGWDS